jgi:hypothetical protein
MKPETFLLIQRAVYLSLAAKNKKNKQRIKELNEKIDDAMWEEFLSPEGEAK